MDTINTESSEMTQDEAAEAFLGKLARPKTWSRTEGGDRLNIKVGTILEDDNSPNGWAEVIAVDPWFTEDGMSFGYGQDEAWIYPMTMRAAHPADAKRMDEAKSKAANAEELRLAKLKDDADTNAAEKAKVISTRDHLTKGLKSSDSVQLEVDEWRLQASWRALHPGSSHLRVLTGTMANGKQAVRLEYGDRDLWLSDVYSDEETINAALVAEAHRLGITEDKARSFMARFAKCRGADIRIALLESLGK